MARPGVRGVLLGVPVLFFGTLGVLGMHNDPPSLRPILTALWVPITVSLAWWHHTKGADATPVPFDSSELGYYRLAMFFFGLFGLLSWWYVETTLAAALLVLSFFLRPDRVER